LKEVQEEPQGRFQYANLSVQEKGRSPDIQRASLGVSRLLASKVTGRLGINLAEIMHVIWGTKAESAKEELDRRTGGKGVDSSELKKTRGKN